MQNNFGFRAARIDLTTCRRLRDIVFLDNAFLHDMFDPPLEWIHLHCTNKRSLLLVLVRNSQEIYCKDLPTDGRTDGWMDGWMDGRTDRWMDGLMDGWMDGWIEMNELKIKSIIINLLFIIIVINYYFYYYINYYYYNLLF